MWNFKLGKNSLGKWFVLERYPNQESNQDWKQLDKTCPKKIWVKKETSQLDNDVLKENQTNILS